MTEEEIAEMKSALEAAQASIKNLETTNRQLKSEKTEAKRLADEAREEAQREADEKAGNIEAVKKSLTDAHAKELAKLHTHLEKLTIDNAIADAVSKNGVLPHFVPAVTAMLRAGAQLNRNGEAIADDLPLEDKITSFFNSEDARHYVAAPDNSGGGARGSSAKSSRWTKLPETAEEMNEFMAFEKTDPAGFAAAAKSMGLPGYV